MKNLLLLAGVFSLSSMMFAQNVESTYTVKVDTTVRSELVSPSKYTIETNLFGHNWFVGAGIGGQMYFGDHSKQMRFFDRLSPVFNVNFGKWFTPGLGIRMEFSGGQINDCSGWTAYNATTSPNENRYNYQGFLVYDNGATIPEVYMDINNPNNHSGITLYKVREQWVNGEIDAMFDLGNLLFGYKPERFYSLIPYVGGGFAFSLNKAHNYVNLVKAPQGMRSYTITGHIGVVNRFRINNHWNINLDVHGILVGDDFDQQVGGSRQNYYYPTLAGKWGEGILTASIGLEYNFLPGWHKSATISRTVTMNYADPRINDKINELQMKNDSLMNELRKSLAVEKDASNICSYPLLVTFDLNKWKLHNRDRVNLGFLAQFLKAHPNVVYSIIGYADKGTGSKKRNWFLSEKRAKVVYNCLVNEFGVPENQLKVSYEGGVANQYYNDPRCSRAVLNKCIVKN